MRMLTVITLLMLSLSQSTLAQQAKEFGAYTVHYNALSTAQLSAPVAQAYGIKRSSNRALLNITVLKNTDAEPSPVRARMSASARNLTGQSRQIELREVNESDEAIYYIGEFRVNNMETFDFKVEIRPESSAQVYELQFRQQFYTE
jgi:hypothetical protein